MFQRAIIIGSPGAGKSTFARRLSEITSLPIYYLDRIWHKPDRTTISKEEFDQRLAEILLTDRWIIDGNYQRTIEARLIACDTAFLLDYPLDVCLAGVESRIGKVRPDMPWIETEFDPEFRQWILDFPRDRLPELSEHLARHGDKNIVRFRSRAESELYLKELSKR